MRPMREHGAPILAGPVVADRHRMRSLRPRALACVLPLGLVLASSGSGEADVMKHQVAYGQYHEALEARDLTRALRHARDAYELAVSELGPRDFQTGILAYNLGAIYLELDYDRDALKTLSIALPIYDAENGPRSPKNLSLRLKLADANQRLERWQEAERHYVGAIRIIEEERGRDEDEIGVILVELGMVATELQQYKRVRSYGLRALHIFEETRGENEPKLGILHLRLARNELELGDASQALRHLRRGEEIIETGLDAGNPQLAGLYDYMAEIAVAAGKPGLSRGYRKKAKASREASGAGSPGPVEP